MFEDKREEYEQRMSKWNLVLTQLDLYSLPEIKVEIPFLLALNSKNLPSFFSEETFCSNSEWKVSVKQNCSKSRPRVRFYLDNYNGVIGVSVKCEAKHYPTLEAIFEAVNKSHVLVGLDQIRETPSQKNVSFEDILDRENRRVLKEVGDWRPAKREIPDNVIDFMSRIKPEPEEIAHSDDFLDELFKKIS